MHGSPIDFDRAATCFRDRRYAYVKDLLPKPVLDYLKAYCEVLRANDKFGPADRGASALGGDPGFDAALCALAPDVSRLVGFLVAPTYSFACRSGEGDDLSRHSDAARHEISVLVALEVPDGAPPAVLHLKSAGLPEEAAEMFEGHGCVYDGGAVECWMEPLPRDGYTQLFLHFVDQQAFTDA
jgi:hypothetical protein